MNGQGTTSVTVSAPTGFTTGDVLIAVIADYDTSSTQTTAPTGWTGVGANGNTGGRVQMFVARYGTNGLTGTSWTWSGLTTRCVGSIAGYSGVASTIYNGTPAVRSNSETGTTTNGLTTTVANSLILAAFLSSHGNYTWSAEQTLMNGALAELAGDYQGTYFDVVWASQLMASAGSTGSTSGTTSNYTYTLGVCIGLTPASSANYPLIIRASRGLSSALIGA